MNKLNLSLYLVGTRFEAAMSRLPRLVEVSFVCPLACMKSLLFSNSLPINLRSCYGGPLYAEDELIYIYTYNLKTILLK